MNTDGTPCQHQQNTLLLKNGPARGSFSDVYSVTKIWSRLVLSSSLNLSAACGLDFKHILYGVCHWVTKNIKSPPYEPLCSSVSRFTVQSSEGLCGKIRHHIPYLQAPPPPHSQNLQRIEIYGIIVMWSNGLSLECWNFMTLKIIFEFHFLKVRH